MGIPSPAIEKHRDLPGAGGPEAGRGVDVISRERNCEDLLETAQVL